MKRIWKRSRVWLPLLTLSGLLCAPQMTPSAQAGLFSMSEQDEIEAGQEVAAQAEKEYGGVLSPNDPMSVRVRAIGSQFAQLSTRKTIPFTYKVLNNDKVLNAFAAPGGPVYVTRRLVTTTANDAELAYVLGHETGHIERKHIVESVKKQQQAGLLVGVLGALLGKGKSSNAIGTIANVGWTVLSRGYSRDQESEADTVGVRWMSQLGYDPRAAISMLGKLGEGGGGFLDKYLATHPNPEKRQALVQQTIDKENLNDVARRSGGPRLTMAGNGYTAYTDSGNYPAPSAPTNNAPYYPPANTPEANGDERIELGAPLLLIKRNNTNLVLGPVNEMARWAGAAVRENNNVTRVQRNDSRLDLRRNSKVATLNGQQITMSSAAVESDGRLYAPIGTVMQGFGGQATYDAQTRSIWLDVDGRRGYVSLP